MGLAGAGWGPQATSFTEKPIRSEQAANGFKKSQLDSVPDSQTLPI